MQVPFHPMIVHFPIALTFLLPVLVLIFSYMIKTGKMSPQGWLILVGLQMVTTATGYISLESGETEEHQVESVVERKFIHEHEETAEVFVGVTVLALVFSVAAYFVARNIQFYLHLSVALISLLSCYFAYKTGELGGELVYRHGAANAYLMVPSAPPQEGLLPTPGMNTSESPMPVDENESLKPDENDYGNADEVLESEDEFRQED